MRKELKYGDKTLKLKKDGTPNLRNLNLAERAYAKELIAKRKQKNLTVSLEELKKVFETL